MAKKIERELKVCAMSGYNYKSVPAIRLMGQWLEAAGFHIGDPVLVKCEDGKLIISLDIARAELMEDEKEALGENMGVTRRVVQKYINVLKESGRIERVGGKRYGYWKINLILRSLKTAYDPFIYWLNRVKIVQMAFGSVNRLLQTSGSLLMNEQTSSLI